MTLQGWRKHVSRLRRATLLVSGGVFIAAFASSWDLLYFIGSIGLILYQLSWRILPKPSEPTYPDQRSAVSKFDDALEEKPKDSLLDGRRQFEAGWEHQLKIIRDEQAKREQRVQEEPKAYLETIPNNQTPHTSPVDNPPRPQQGINRPAVAQVPTMQPSPSQQVEMSIGALQSRIGDNIFEMGTLPPDSMEYSRREREIRRDRQVIAEIESKSARPEPIRPNRKLNPIAKPSNPHGLKLGDIITHAIFDEGHVTSISIDGIVTIDFGQRGTKSFAITPANACLLYTSPSPRDS